MAVKESQISTGNNPKIIRGIIGVAVGLLLLWVIGIFVWIGDSVEVADTPEGQDFLASVENSDFGENQRLEVLLPKKESEELSLDQALRPSIETVEVLPLENNEVEESVEARKLPAWTLVVDSSLWMQTKLLENLNGHSDVLTGYRYQLIIESSSAFFFKIDGKIGLADEDNPMLLNYTKDLFLMGAKQGLTSVNFRVVALSS